MLLSRLAGATQASGGAGLLQEGCHWTLPPDKHPKLRRGFVEVHFLVAHVICMSVHTAVYKLTMTTLKIDEEENGPRTDPESDEIVGNRPNVSQNKEL